MGENNRYLNRFFLSLSLFHILKPTLKPQQLCFDAYARPASALMAPSSSPLFFAHSTPYTPLDKRAMDNTDEDTATDDWTLEQPLAQTRTTAIVEVKGAINVVLTPLVAESLDRY